MDTLFPKVLQAVAGEDFTVYLYFNDGSVRLYDAKPLLALGGVFAPLQDEAFFKSRLTVLNDTAAWDVNGDRDPVKMRRIMVTVKHCDPYPAKQTDLRHNTSHLFNVSISYFSKKVYILYPVLCS